MMLSRKFILILALICVTILALSAGGAWLLDELSQPESTNMVEFVQENDVTLDNARSANELAQADERLATAEQTRTQVWMQRLNYGLTLIGCVVGLIVLIVIAAFFQSLKRDDE